MLITPVVKEFNDYRAYVSHDICKQRLLLAMWSIDGAERALNDAYAWDLFRNEAIRLFDLAPTLFGFVTSIFRNGKKRLNQFIALVDQERPGVLKGQERSYVVVKESIEHVSALLSALPEQMKDQRPGFSEQNIILYLDGCDAARCEIEFRKFISLELVPLVKRVFLTRGDNGSYADFWARCPEADLYLRKLLVALSLEDKGPDHSPVVEIGKIRMRALRQAVSSYSLSVPSADRKQALMDSLGAFGFGSVEELTDAVVDLAES